MALHQPTLLAIDDLHWADTPSLRWLLYLTRRLEGVPLLVVAGTRPPEGEGHDPMLVAELIADPEAAVIRPEPLGRGSMLDAYLQLLNLAGISTPERLEVMEPPPGTIGMLRMRHKVFIPADEFSRDVFAQLLGLTALFAAQLGPKDAIIAAKAALAMIVGQAASKIRLLTDDERAAVGELIKLYKSDPSKVTDRDILERSNGRYNKGTLLSLRRRGIIRDGLRERS